MQIPAGTCMYAGRCRYLPRMWVPVARVGSSMARMLPWMTGMDFWPWVPVLADADVSGYAIMKISSVSSHPYGLHDKRGWYMEFQVMQCHAHPCVSDLTIHITPVYIRAWLNGCVVYCKCALGLGMGSILLWCNLFETNFLSSSNSQRFSDTHIGLAYHILIAL